MPMGQQLHLTFGFVAKDMINGIDRDKSFTRRFAAPSSGAKGVSLTTMANAKS